MTGSKRTFSEMMEGGQEEKVEEWSLRDVIFVDHVTNLNVGVVVKLDGNYVAVHYPAIEGEELSQVDISKCRLLLKDEMVVSWVGVVSLVVVLRDVVSAQGMYSFCVCVCVRPCCM